MTASDVTATYHTLRNIGMVGTLLISSCDYRIGKERKERQTEEGKGEATTYKVRNKKS